MIVSLFRFPYSEKRNPNTKQLEQCTPCIRQLWKTAEIPSIHPSVEQVDNRLLEGNETGRVGGTDTGSTVLDGLAV